MYGLHGCASRFKLSLFNHVAKFVSWAVVCWRIEWLEFVVCVNKLRQLTRNEGWIQTSLCTAPTRTHRRRMASRAVHAVEIVHLATVILVLFVFGQRWSVDIVRCPAVVRANEGWVVITKSMCIEHLLSHACMDTPPCAAMTSCLCSPPFFQQETLSRYLDFISRVRAFACDLWENYACVSSSFWLHVFSHITHHTSSIPRVVCARIIPSSDHGSPKNV